MGKRCRVLLLIGLYLGLHNGYLALWSSDRSEPDQVFPYRASLYPKCDRDALERGIPIAGNEQLKHVLEDFLS